MTQKARLSVIAATMVLTASAPAALFIDFNSNQEGGGAPTVGEPANPTTALHNEPGYQSYHVTHESAAHMDPATAGVYSTTFALTGPAVVSLLPAWPGTTNINVRQSIGRTGGQADTWLGNHQNLLRDFIGIDSRTASGGLGPWDGTTGDPTYMTLTLGGLPAAEYWMTSFHHDVENMNSFFTIEVSTDGGDTFGIPINGRMTNSLPGGTPAENEVLGGQGVNIAGGDPRALSSTQQFGFETTGDTVVLRYATLGPVGMPVHQTFFGINGFELTQIPEPTTAFLSLLGAGLFLRRRRA